MTCGPKNFDWIVPDKLFGLNMVEACREHDKLYARPGVLTKEQIDKKFYNTNKSNAKNWLQRLVAWIYYKAVCSFIGKRVYDNNR